jgi:hypothetical protein
VLNEVLNSSNFFKTKNLKKISNEKESKINTIVDEKKMIIETIEKNEKIEKKEKIENQELISTVANSNKKKIENFEKKIFFYEEHEVEKKKKITIENLTATGFLFLLFF